MQGQRSDEKRDLKSAGIVRGSDDEVEFDSCWRWHSRSVKEGKISDSDNELDCKMSVWVENGTKRLVISSSFVHSLTNSVSLPDSLNTALMSAFISSNRSAIQQWAY